MTPLSVYVHSNLRCLCGSLWYSPVCILPSKFSNSYITWRILSIYYYSYRWQCQHV